MNRWWHDSQCYNRLSCLVRFAGTNALSCFDDGNSLVVDGSGLLKAESKMKLEGYVET